MAPHTITPSVEVVCHCKENAALRRSPRGLHTQTRLSSLLRLNLNSSLKTTWFFRCSSDSFVRGTTPPLRHCWLVVKGSTRNGCRNPKCPSSERLCMVREDTGAPSEGAPCAWLAVDEAVGCTCAFLAMWRSSR
ncbi:uncharacterized protein TNCV_445881 [Trichonephila clavipes]|nr:uncharacterized protein TNCV_445881 [Trichonephila clavipes]